jgi:hypothetical protein
MSRTLLFLIILCTSALAAERPKGFLGINWGASPEEAKRIMQARPGVKFPEETDDYKFELTGGFFADKPVAKWILEFPDRKFASAVVVLKVDGDASELYKEFRTQLVVKYGSATTDKKLSAKGPDRRPAGGGERPTSLGNSTIWKFAPNLKEKNNVSIVCELAGPNGAPATAEAQLGVSIRYINDTLLGAAKDSAAAGAKAAGKPGVKKDEL